MGTVFIMKPQASPSYQRFYSILCHHFKSNSCRRGGLGERGNIIQYKCNVMYAGGQCCFNVAHDHNPCAILHINHHQKHCKHFCRPT